MGKLRLRKEKGFGMAKARRMKSLKVREAEREGCLGAACFWFLREN